MCKVFKQQQIALASSFILWHSSSPNASEDYSISESKKSRSSSSTATRTVGVVEPRVVVKIPLNKIASTKKMSSSSNAVSIVCLSTWIWPLWEPFVLILHTLKQRNTQSYKTETKVVAQCLKITRNVAFEFFYFGIFLTNFGPIKIGISGITV